VGKVCESGGKDKLETYLQEITKLMSLRLKERTLATLRETVEGSAREKIEQSRKEVIRELKKQGISDETAIQAALKDISATVTAEFMKTEGTVLLSKVPQIIQSEGIKLGEELAQAVKEATAHAAAEVTRELTVRKG
jgi:hypothetical protein